MRPLASEGFRFKNARARNAHAAARNAPAVSWLSSAQIHADRAATAGFVLSMLFLGAAAFYALSLPEAAKPLLSEVFAFADQRAFDAGFRLEDLALSGSRNTPEAAVFEALKLPYKGSSLFYDAKEARSRLLSVGWIESAEVRRILPSRLEVIVSERRPFARWEDSGHEVHVIDSEGRILGRDGDERFGSLPLFAGEGAPAQASYFQDALQDHEGLRGRIKRAELIAGRFWLVKLDPGPLLKLPRKLTPSVLERLDSLLASPKIEMLGLEAIDLRLSNRTILQLLDPTVANRDKAIAVLTAAPSRGQPAPERVKAL